jgi:hypothetical protein
MELGPAFIWLCLRQNVGGDPYVLAYLESRDNPHLKKYYISGYVQLAKV